MRIAPSWSEPNIPDLQLTKIRALFEGAAISEGLLIRDGIYLFLVDAQGMAEATAHAPKP